MYAPEILYSFIFDLIYELYQHTGFDKSGSPRIGVTRLAGDAHFPGAHDRTFCARFLPMFVYFLYPMRLSCPKAQGQLGVIVIQK